MRQAANFGRYYNNPPPNAPARTHLLLCLVASRFAFFQPGNLPLRAIDLRLQLNNLLLQLFES